MQFKIPNEFQKNSKRIPKEFQKNSKRIPKNSQKSEPPQPYIPQTIPKEFPRNSQKISEEFPKNYQKLKKKIQNRLSQNHTYIELIPLKKMSRNIYFFHFLGWNNSFGLGLWTRSLVQFKQS